MTHLQGSHIVVFELSLRLMHKKVLWVLFPTHCILIYFQVEDQSAGSMCHIALMHHAFVNLRMHLD